MNYRRWLPRAKRQYNTPDDSLPEWMVKPPDVSYPHQAVLRLDKINEIAAMIKSQPGTLRIKHSHRIARTVTKYSPEVITHANYLRQTQGEKAATAYINNIREGGPVANEEHESVSVIHEGGKLELALRDAESKAAYFNREADRWNKIVSQMRDIVSSFNREFRPSNRQQPNGKHGKQGKLQRGEGIQLIVRAMELLKPDDPTRGIEKTTLKNKFEEVYKAHANKTIVGPGSYYQINRAAELGYIVDIGNKRYVLPEWKQKEQKKAS